MRTAIALLTTAAIGAVALPSIAFAQFETAETIPARRDCPTKMAEVDRADCLLAQMTLSEKALFVSGTGFDSHGVERLGIPAFKMSDGPKGVRTDGKPNATAFPGGVSLASTWNPGLVGRASAAMGEEAKALGISVLLGPGVNIQRHPLGGRNFEYYSEDPMLAGEIGVGWVKGIQGVGVAATPKHFAANNQETNRFWNDSMVDERTLREIYLPQFERIVTKAHPWSIMSSYNRINGTYAAHNHWLLTDVLRTEWGFDGVVISDWTGLHDTVAGMNAGLDLEMPSTKYYGPLLRDAVSVKSVAESTLDESVRRILRLQIRTGSLDRKATPNPASPDIGSTPHLALARQVANESIVLLRNDRNILPLKPGTKVALIGPNADPTTYQGAGSSEVSATRKISIRDGIIAASGTAPVATLSGAVNDPAIPSAELADFSVGPDGKVAGLSQSLFTSPDFAGQPVATGDDQTLLISGFGGVGNKPPADVKAKRWSGWFNARRDGVYRFNTGGAGKVALYIDDKLVLDTRSAGAAVTFFDQTLEGHEGDAPLTSGRHSFRLDYVMPETPSKSFFGDVLRLGVRPPVGTIEQAVAAAKAADVAVVVIGLSMTAETEGFDRKDIELPGEQNRLVEAVLAANPNTVVILNAGGPLHMPWADKAHTLVEAWYPGQEGGYAVGDMLFGKVNPSGKLPVSFPKRIEDTPAYTYAKNTRTAFYGEGVFVGYRHYDSRKMDVLFPFGHGLSYTSFAYDAPIVPAKASTESNVMVSVRVKNSGQRKGAETVQLYIAPLNPAEPRPVHELKGFEKVELAPGESRTVSFTLTPRDFAYWDIKAHGWLTEAGPYRIEVGSSSRDIRGSAVVTLDADASKQN